MLSVTPAPAQEALFAGCTVTAAGRSVPVYLARVSRMPYNWGWPGHQRPLDQTEPAGFCCFETDGPVAVCVTFAKPFRTVCVRPTSKAVAARVQGRTVTFTLPAPGQYTVETDGLHEALHLFADSGRRETPVGRVTRFPAGVHHIGIHEMQSNETVVLEAGAVVYGSLVAYSAEKLTVTGTGILDGSLEERTDASELLPGSPGADELDFTRMSADEMRAYVAAHHVLAGCIHFYNCKNITVSHVVCRDSATFTILPANCENVIIDEVKLIGNWRYNSDGIDLCNCRNCVIRDSFLRDFDDCVVIKGISGWAHRAIRNILVERCVIWCDWGRALEIGAETNASEYCQLLFRDCDILHGTWVLLDIQHHNDAMIHDIVFDDIRCEYQAAQQPLKMQENEAEPYEEAKTLLEQPTLLGAFFYDMGLFGAPHGKDGISHIAFRNIQVLAEPGVPMPACEFRGLSPYNLVRDVQIKDLTLNGRHLVTDKEAHLIRGPYTCDISLL